MIFLLIKGGYGEATAKAAQLGVPIEVKQSNGSETHAMCEGYHIDMVKAWYLSDAGLSAPYQPGSLLHYAVRGNVR